MIDWSVTLAFDKRTHPRRGDGATITLFDSGIALDRPLPDNFHNLLGLQGPQAEPRSNRHAERIAMLAASEQGVSPGATVYTAHYGPLFPDKFQTFLQQARVKTNIVGFPFSAPETAQLALLGSSALVTGFEQPDGALMVASSGHDGHDNVRFPGGCNAALTVGMMDQEGQLHPRSGHNAATAKPDLLVEDANYESALLDGTPSAIDGSSAAVAIVCGVAALWVERFKQKQWTITPWGLRSVMMASAISVQQPDQPWRKLSLAHIDSSSGVASFSADARTSRDWIVSISGQAQTSTLGIGMRISPGTALWLPPDLKASLYSLENCRQPLYELNNHGAFDQLNVGQRYLLRLDERVTDFTLSVVADNDISLEAKPVKQTTESNDKTASQVIVGISASHDASACVIVDGEIKHAIQLERISRKKHDGFPYLSHDDAVDYCLSAAGLTRDDVDIYAFNSQPLYPGQVGLSTPVSGPDFSCFSPFDSHALHVSHHLCHAFAAQILADQNEAAVLVIDGSGGAVAGANDHILDGPQLQHYLTAESHDLASLPGLHVMSLYRFTKTDYELVSRETAPSFNVRHGSSSIGEAYASVAQYIFGSWQNSGKVMGLAPYGKPQGSFLLPKEAGEYRRFGNDWKLAYQHGGGDPVQQHADLAATIQNDLEVCLIDRIETLAKKVPVKELFYSGGVALNCKANQRIEKQTPVSKLTVFPASSDAGNAIGAAAAAYFKLNGKMLRANEAVYNDYWGYPYSEADILLSIREYSDFIQVAPYHSDEVAKHLDNGEIIAWFDAGSEFGPRALGHRSILADPRKAALRDRVNRDVKYREEFRPFAPVCLANEAANWFDVTTEYPFMTHTVNVLPHVRSALPAITHVDGSARLQTITDACNPKLATLLAEFKKRTDYAVLINTSLNMRGQPIIETPLQAVELLLCSGIDRLVIGDYVLHCHDPFTASDIYDLKIALAPDVQLSSEHTGRSAQKSCLISSKQRNLAYQLPGVLLSVLDKVVQDRLSLSQAINVLGLENDDISMPFVTALLAEKLILAKGNESADG